MITRQPLLDKFIGKHAEDAYRNYQKQLELSQSHLDTLLSDTSSTLDLLASLTSSFKAVEAQTTMFQKQCAGLQDEQTRITRLADNLEDNLKYYNYLESVTRRLNAPGAGNFVRSKEFSEMLARLDECLGYMAAHVRILLGEGVGQDELTMSAKTTRSSHLPIALPFADDKRPDSDSCPFRRCFARDCF